MTYGEGIRPWAERAALYPQTALAQHGTRQRTLVVGIPKEHSLEEGRICLNPAAVNTLIEADHTVWIERGAGAAVKYSDEAYAGAGAQIIEDAAEVFKADIVLKVEPPTIREIGYMKAHTLLISAIQMTRLDARYFQSLQEKKITSLAFEFLKDANKVRPVVRAMSEITGSMVIFIAAEHLAIEHGGAGILVGGVTGLPPPHIVVLGAGTVAEYAARMALGLGADVQVFDEHLHKLRRIQQAIGKPVFTSIIERDTLRAALEKADILIGAVQMSDSHKPHLVSEEMVMAMKPESIILDVSIDQGKCVETSAITTHSDPVFRKHGVIHYGVPNITSRAARTATMALSHILAPLLLDMGESANEKDYLLGHPHVAEGIYTYKGYLTNAHLALHFDRAHKDLNMLMF